MAEYIVLLGYSVPEGVVDEIEALLVIHFPEYQFRFGVTPEHAQGFSVLPIRGDGARAGGNYDSIMLLIQETLDAHNRARAQ
jgi:hypothetical protein